MSRCAQGMLGFLVCSASLACAGAPEAVSFDASDGVRLKADYYPPPAAQRQDAPIVLVLHGAGAERTAWEPLVGPLHEAGLAVLALDLRGHGESATTVTRERAVQRDPQLFRDMYADVRGAYDWLARQPHVDRARFALVGAGVGGNVALRYAAEDRSVDALVCLSTHLADLGHDAAGDAHQITGRRLLLVGGADERDALYTLKKQTDGVEVRLADEHAGHGTELLSDEELTRGLAHFVKTAVGDATTTTVYGTINSNVYHRADSGWLGKIAPTNLRHYSSPQEAEARGLRESRSRGPGSGDNAGGAARGGSDPNAGTPRDPNSGPRKGAGGKRRP
jgi:dienelactone hydrolase